MIVKQDIDLLAMAPTGSGKTAVALIAILQAFKRGLRAVYTSPIKALSNQKYAEFCEWFLSASYDIRDAVVVIMSSRRDAFVHAGSARRVLTRTLLYLPVTLRSEPRPGSEKELIICTSEILRNKLVKASGTQPAAVHFAAAKAAADAGDLRPRPRWRLDPRRVHGRRRSRS